MKILYLLIFDKLAVAMATKLRNTGKIIDFDYIYILTVT